MEVLKEELKIKSAKLLHVFMFAQEAYLYTEYFHNPKTQEELDLVYKSTHTRQLLTIMHLMFRTVVVEVAKLYSSSPNDNFSIKHFIKNLSPAARYRKCGVSQAHIASWNKRLDESEPIIGKIITLRDKLYAHTDNPLLDYNELDISFKDIKSLLDLAEEIAKQLYEDVHNAHLLTDPVTFDRDRFDLLSVLAKAEKQWRADIIKNAFPRK